MVLVDTSIWVAYLRGTASSLIVRAMNKLLDRHEIAITPVIRLELLRGASTEEAGTLADAMVGLHQLPFEHPHWERADRLVMELRAKGLTLSFADLLIATSALEHNIRLYHQDDTFETAARCTSLKVYRPTP